MFSSEFCAYVEKTYATAEIKADLNGLSDDEAILLKFLYGTLPLSDTASVPQNVLMGYVRHALMLRGTSPFCKDLPEDMFLHFVLYPRVNSENLEDCRGFFYEKLWEKVKDLPTPEAVLAVNRWCCENMTYRASNDRTESPMTAYRSGIGRCGEESTFAVTALRSVGIAARQIYVPYWAHCDDNHAWVEAFAGGKWVFLGACEPEPVLNRGWFTDASSRAPLECYRTFSEFVGEAMKNDECIDRTGTCCLFNEVDRYAPAIDFTVTVKNEDGTPAVNTEVRIQVVNMAAYRPIATLKTDSNGACRIRMGKVSVHVEAAENGCTAEADVDAAQQTNVSLILKPVEASRLRSCTVSEHVPAAVPFNRTVLTDAQQAEHDRVLARCAELRNSRISSYYLKEYDALDTQWQEILHTAAGNAAEIYSLYQDLPEEERAVYKDMLFAMETKDWRDTPAWLLKAHLKAALPYRNEPHFVKEILNPRVHNEMLEDWRSLILNAFSAEDQARFRKDPATVMETVNRLYSAAPQRSYGTLSFVPSAVLKTGKADEEGRKILFVAILRTLGVPARLNPVDGRAEFYRDGCYVAVTAKSAGAQGTILLEPEQGKRFVYEGNFTIARRDENGKYQVLNGADADDDFTFAVVPGEYRLLTSNRLPNGNQLVNVTDFALNAGETVRVPLRLCEASPEEMLGNGQLEEFTVRDENGTLVSSKTLLTGTTVLVYLDVSKEPTEHILNEIREATDKVNDEIRKGLKLVYVLRDVKDRQDPTLTRTMSAVPQVQFYYDNFSSSSSTLARKLFLEPGVRPLLCLTDETHRGYYGTCGYQVGTLELTVKLIDCLRKQR